LTIIEEKLREKRDKATEKARLADARAARALNEAVRRGRIAEEAWEKVHHAQVRLKELLES